MAAHISLPIMEEKRPTRARPVRRSRAIIGLIIIAVCLYMLDVVHIATGFTGRLVSSSSAGHTVEVPISDDALKTTSAIANKNLVPLEAHIMSKCPDARDCLKQLVLPAMMRVNDKVNFTLSFIGTPTESNDGVDCKHGPNECMGNIIELCAAQLYPETKIYLGFVMCLERDYKDIPGRSLVEDCALEHGIDFEKLNDCAAQDDGAFGIGMLRRSVQRTIDAGVIKSCTVRLNEDIYCILDDAEWKDCPNGPGVNDLVIAVEKLYGRSA
ncbi:hypothetical protein BX600DRAFT_8639 [Xylariales sp. PMI_506]|nr:hypothetical protein BX600DRAFT_8639 [Xylariales sp. PMI_506]